MEANSWINPSEKNRRTGQNYNWQLNNTSIL